MHTFHKKQIYFKIKLYITTVDGKTKIEGESKDEHIIIKVLKIALYRK